MAVASLLAFNIAFSLRGPSPAAHVVLQHRSCADRFSGGIFCTEDDNLALDQDEERTPSAPRKADEKMTMMDNLIFLGYIGGFMAFFFAFATVLKTLGGQQ